MNRSTQRAAAALAIGLAGPAQAAGMNALVINAQGGGAPDYARAVPESIPTATVPVQPAANGASIRYPAAPFVHAGKAGTGAVNPVRLAPPKPPAQPAAPSGRSTLAHGFSNLPFNTARVTVGDVPLAQTYPYSAAGKLVFNVQNGQPSHCTTSLIGPGLVLTAAHCVSEFGHKTLFTNVQYAPAYHNGVAPFGTWSASSIIVPDDYFNGTSSCTTRGVVCTDDIALVTLLPSASGDLPGNETGYLGVGINGAGFVNGTVLVTQLGYPGNLDRGERMERNDAQGSVNPDESDNTIIGSLMGGGSSGGPWIINFGESPINSTTAALESTRNAVIGVTSFGETSSLPKYQGASPFTSDNFGVLYAKACAASPSSCE